MIPLRCNRCGIVWQYRGLSDYRTTCPNCGTTVSIRHCQVSVQDLIAYIRRDEEMRRLKFEQMVKELEEEVNA